MPRPARLDAAGILSCVPRDDVDFQIVWTDVVSLSGTDFGFSSLFGTEADNPNVSLGGVSG